MFNYLIHMKDLYLKMKLGFSSKLCNVVNHCLYDQSLWLTWNHNMSYVPIKQINLSACVHIDVCVSACYSVSIVTASLKFMGFKSCQLRKDECTLFIYSSTIHNKLFQHLSSSCNIAGYIFFFKLLQHGTLFIFCKMSVCFKFDFIMVA